MVRAIEEEQENYRSRVLKFRGMHESAGRHGKRMSFDGGSSLDPADDDSTTMFCKESDHPLGRQKNGFAPKGTESRLSKDAAAAKDKQPSGKSPFSFSNANIHFNHSSLTISCCKSFVNFFVPIPQR